MTPPPADLVLTVLLCMIALIGLIAIRDWYERWLWKDERSHDEVEGRNDYGERIE